MPFCSDRQSVCVAGAKGLFGWVAGGSGSSTWGGALKSTAHPHTPVVFLNERGREEEVWEDTAESPSCVGLCNKRKHSWAEGAKR